MEGAQEERGYYPIPRRVFLELISVIPFCIYGNSNRVFQRFLSFS
jgi:hypothetical protein